MIIDGIMLLGGLILLVMAADQFVLGAARVAHVWDVPPVIVGAVIMGFGTSAPELVVSATAARQGDVALGVGNVVGSNVANLSLVLAAAALTTTLAIGRSTMRREGPLSVAATTVFAWVVWDGDLTRSEGVLLLVLLVAVVGFLVTVGVVQGDEEVSEAAEGARSGSAELGRVVAGLIGTVVAARLVVDGSTGLAENWGLTGGFIGFSLVALGTSLPELVTTLAAARRGETGLIVGNLLGSNVFNSLAVGAGIGLFGAGAIDDDTLSGAGVVLMMIVAVVSLALAAMGSRLRKTDGAILLAIYVVSMVILARGADADDESEQASERPGLVWVSERPG